MGSTTVEVREKLLHSSEKFRKLSEEHSKYDQKLGDLSGKSFLSEEERVEEVNLKKLKLQVKDQMERMIRDFKQSGVG